jgi:hypothetical protein
MAEEAASRVSLGPVLLSMHQDTDSGLRYVMREHANGFSRSVLQWRSDEERWRTIAHVEKLFEDK